MKSNKLHLVYIHGFRGDETSFQSFPSDLHHQLLSKLPEEFQLNSYLYPVYKTVRPISEASSNFLKWLDKQSPGPVILMAHSMGGLLAVEAITASNSVSKRVIGLINFDVPFLGMHPHVVISGIASLFPKDDKSSIKTERELNGEQPVKFVNPESVEEKLQEGPALDRTSLQSASTDSTVSPQPKSPLHFVERALSIYDKYKDDPRVRWFHKHSNDPLSAMRRWITEHFEFGSCMFDPRGLIVRYRSLEMWSDSWINYYTLIVPKKDENVSLEITDTMDLDTSFLDNDVNLSSTDETMLEAVVASSKENENSSPAKIKSEVKTIKKAKEKVEKEEKARRKGDGNNDSQKTSRHFIVLPLGWMWAHAGIVSGKKWEPVQIANASDEVIAHCGIFIRTLNSNYDEFVERVAAQVLKWLPK